jgi:renalase
VSPAAQRIAVIGAGLSGLTLAHALQARGHEVLVFEKSEGPGGRCATRRNSAGWFDHGAPQAQAATPGFAAQLREWQALGVLASPDGGQTFTGIPFMNAWMRWLAQGVTLRTRTHIAALEREENAWRLRALEGPDLQAAPQAPFDAVAVAVPAEQAAPLLSPAPALAEAARSVRSAPCWTVMAAWPNPLPLREPVLRNADALAPLAWAICQDRRAGRVDHPEAPHDGGTRWVLHAGADWSANNLDATPDAVAQRLLSALSDIVGVRLARPSWSGAHCWHQAQVPEPRSEPCAWDAALRLGFCGDAWCAADGALGLERAWLSARRLAKEISAAH